MTHPRDYDYSAAHLSCDLVMKGGITSGVVYPHAICELARTYRLKQIGGASAGAIAAAAAGAAEAGRSHGGFRKLAELPEWIGAGTNLLSLFQPQAGTARLFRLLVAFLGPSRLRRVLGAILRGFWPAATLGAAPGIVLAVLGVLVASDWALMLVLVCALLLAVVGAALATLASIVVTAGHALPANRFGFCSGYRRQADGPAPLTPWLAATLQELAGKRMDDPPLTFGELEAAGVTLNLMTTNLTQRRAQRLPWSTREFFFAPAEFRELFPPDIVDWLEQHPPTPPEQEGERKRWEITLRLMEPYRPLPDPADFPVVVATRMSLSFPLLLSAVPLVAVDWSRKVNQQALTAWRSWQPGSPEPEPALEPETCWFSDGGISSNLPVHFFDSPLPRWPTFTINLRPFHPDYPQSDREEDNVYLVGRSGAGVLESWYRLSPRPGLGRLVGFASSIVRTMQVRVDEAQIRVPGYRDRIVHVSHAPDEGGLNLTMPEPVIRRLTERGRWAGTRLVERFARPAADPMQLSWASHRWTRYRSSLSVLSEFLHRLSIGYETLPDPGEPSYRQLIERDHDKWTNAYEWSSRAQEAAALDRTERISQLGGELGSEPTFTDGAPRPAPELRIAPRG